MYCPVCRSEYRPGFTRCATCEVDLVAELGSPSAGATAPPDVEALLVSRAEPRALFCGFHELEEARKARVQLRAHGIGSDILIREAAESEGENAEQDEFWLLVSRRDFRAAHGILGDDLGEPSAGETVYCSSCGESVDASDDACPHCGERFEEA